ncbi:MAG: carbonic anhydrase [Acidobacteriaceae bacterium]
MACAKVFVLSCIDPRFRHATQEFVEQTFRVAPEEYDHKTDAGGCRELKKENFPGAAAWIEKNIEIGCMHHGTETIVLVNHLDCAYYGGSAAFPDAETELATHREDLESARKILGMKFPDAAVMAFIVGKNNGQFQFERVV